MLNYSFKNKDRDIAQIHCQQKYYNTYNVDQFSQPSFDFRVLDVFFLQLSYQIVNCSSTATVTLAFIYQCCIILVRSNSLCTDDLKKSAMDYYNM